MTDVYQTQFDKLFAKYRHSPNILGVLAILADPAQDTRDVEDWFLSNLSIDGGTGWALDLFGEMLGIIRPPAQEDDVLWLCEDWEVADDPDNRYGLATDALTEGGYMTSDVGVLDKSAGGGSSDTLFRQFIRAKGSAFHRVATRANLFDYLKAYGCRWKILESTRTAELEPYDFDVINYYVRHYLVTQGFLPAGIEVTVAVQTEASPDV